MSSVPRRQPCTASAPKRLVTFALLTTGICASATSIAQSGSGLRGDPNSLPFAPLITRLGAGEASGPGLKLDILTDAFADLAGIGIASSVGLALRPTTRAAALLSASSHRFSAGLSLGRASEPRVDGLHTAARGVDATSIGLTGAYRIAANWDVTGAYSSAFTEATPAAGDGLQRRALTRTRTLSLGLAKSETWLRGDRLALSLGQPTRLQGDDRDAPLERIDALESDQAHRVGLRPGTREWLTELNYFAPLSKRTGLGLSLVNRSRLAADVNGPDERIMSIRFSTRF